jgi:hypothetical protein
MNHTPSQLQVRAMSPSVVDRNMPLGATMRLQLGLVDNPSTSCMELDLEALAQRLNWGTQSNSSMYENLDIVLDLEVGLILKLIGDMPLPYTLSISFPLGPSTQISMPPSPTNSTSLAPPSPPTDETSQPCTSACIFTMFEDDCCAPLNQIFSVSLLDLKVDDSQQTLQLFASMSLNLSGPVQLMPSDVLVRANTSCNSMLMLRAAFEPLSNYHESRGRGACVTGEKGTRCSTVCNDKLELNHLGGMEVHVDPILVRYNDTTTCSQANFPETHHLRIRAVVPRNNTLSLLQALREGSSR